MKTCPKCGDAKPLTEFNKKRSTKDGLQVWCRCCSNTAALKSRHKHSRKYTAKRREVLYGCSEAKFNSLMQDQEGRCAVCASSIQFSCHVDHNHATGEIRGLLCRPCNTGLGQFKDDPKILRAAVAYLSSRGNYAGLTTSSP